MSQHFEILNKLRDLRTEANLMIGAHAETSRKALDRMIAVAEKDPNDEKIIERAKVHDALRLAALRRQSYTYTANAELADGTLRNKGDTVDAQAEVSRIQVTSINNFIAPMATALEFFQVENFADNVVPYFDNKTQHEMTFALVGQDGGVLSRSGAIVKSQSQLQLPGPWELASPVVKYKLRDLQRGNVGDELLGLVNIARDQALNLDQRLWTRLKSSGAGMTGALRAFNWTTGAPEKRTAMLHSSIDSANLPTTNVIDAGSGYTGNIDVSLLNQAILHGAKLSNVYDQDIYPVAFYFPSSSAMSVLTTVTSTTNDKTATLSAQIMGSGYITSLAGRNFIYRPLSTLAASGKLAYVRYNRPVGIVGFKPGMDQTFNEQFPAANYGQISAMKVWTAAICEQWRTGIASIRYKT